MAFTKAAKRAYKKGKKYLKKRYVKKGGPNMKNIMADVKMLKHLVNIEKKRYDNTLLTVTNFAKQNGAGNDNFYAAPITPTPPEGIAQGERIGQSIKLVSGCLDIQFAQQANCINDLKIKLWLINRPDNSSATGATISTQQLLEVNPFSGRRDFYSNRDPEYFGSFRVIKCMTLDLKQDSVGSGISYIQKKIPLKFNLHQKYVSDTTTVTTKNQIYLIATCSDGDTLLGTGATLVYNMRWYYTDN